MHSDSSGAIAQAPPRVNTPPAPPAPTRAQAAIALLARLLLVCVFIAASLPKIHSPHEFALSIYRYQLLPDTWINAAAVFTPWCELAAAFFLLFVPGFRKPALSILGMLLLVFTAAIASAICRGINISCGCFSVSSEVGQIGWWSLARNAALIGVVWLCWRCQRQPANLQRGEIP